jgi:FkbM family methyltransferase
MKLKITTIKNWYNRILRYGLRNAVTLMLHLRKDRVFRFRYDSNDLWLRGNSVDFYVFDSIFGRGEYDFVTGFSPAYIVDAGAFTGLSTIWFHKKFPGAKIIAIEPEESNFNLLVRNTSNCDNIIPVKGAVYSEAIQLSISNPTAEKYAFRVGESNSGGSQVEGFSLGELMERHELPWIDLLKMDIEGAEYPVFMNDPASWLKDVGGLIIELHEYIHPGVSELVVNILQSNDFVISHRGENLIAFRTDWDKADSSVRKK